VSKLSNQVKSFEYFISIVYFKMNIFVENRRKKIEAINKKYDQCEIVDVTSKAEMPWVKFSPFYPHGGIPVPFSYPVTGASVEGIWQGLKVFETVNIDVNIINKTSMSMLKRTTRKHGKIIGHRAGVNGERILSYVEARQEIYTPCYEYVLKEYLDEELEQLIKIAKSKPLVLLDYETNLDIDDVSKPLSHASLIIRYIKHGKH
jgi:hypothetical protein